MINTACYLTCLSEGMDCFAPFQDPGQPEACSRVLTRAKSSLSFRPLDPCFELVLLKRSEKGLIEEAFAEDEFSAGGCFRWVEQSSLNEEQHDSNKWFHQNAHMIWTERPRHEVPMYVALDTRILWKCPIFQRGCKREQLYGVVCCETPAPPECVPLSSLLWQGPPNPPPILTRSRPFRHSLWLQHFMLDASKSSFPPEKRQRTISVFIG